MKHLPRLTIFWTVKKCLNKFKQFKSHNQISMSNSKPLQAIKNESHHQIFMSNPKPHLPIKNESTSFNFLIILDTLNET